MQFPRCFSKYGFTVLMASLLQAYATISFSQSPSISTKAPDAALRPLRSQAPMQLKVITQPFITFVPFYIALKEGYYAEQGLGVELINTAINQQILPALSSGQVDVSSGLLSSGMLNAIARGGNFKIVADKGYIDPRGCDNYVLMARRDLVKRGAFRRPEDLRGHTVDVVPATWLEFYLAKLLETGGLTLKDIKTTDLPPPVEPEAFEKKTMELTIISEPWVTRLKKAGHSSVLKSASQILPDTEAAVVLYGPTLLDKNRDFGIRFMIAYLKAVRQYNEGKTPRNIELLAQFTHLDPVLLQEMCWPALRRTGELNVQSVLDFQKWAINVDYLGDTLTPDQFWDGSFVKAANKALDEKK